MKSTILVTGGNGFIGSALIRMLLDEKRKIIINIDTMTYAGDTERLPDSDSIHNIRGNICNKELVAQLLDLHRPNKIFHLAAESHVDRSIDSPQIFIESNVYGTLNLLQCATQYWQNLNESDKRLFRFIHISTDEVYGSLGFEDKAFTEKSPYRPSSPYAASKAASDHLVYSWWKTFNLPTIITHSSNNYGPWQFPEKLIPLMISKALREEKLPVYGDGANIRDWIFVEDHVRALIKIAKHSSPGESWNIGGESEVSNLHLVQYLCNHLDNFKPRSSGLPYSDLITFVTDRPGHDLRYAVNIEKLKAKVGWMPSVSFDQGLTSTIHWYVRNQDWIKRISNKADYMKQNRLGLQPSV